MKRLVLSFITASLILLSGLSCRTPTNPDAWFDTTEVGSADVELSGGQSADVQPTGGQSAAAQPFGGRSGDAQPADAQPGGTLSVGLRHEGEAEMKALARAYPDRINGVAFWEDDWAVRIDDTWYFWARGRLLPQELRHEREQYASYRFYSYAFGLPPIRSLDEEAKRRLKERLERAAEDPPRRHAAFLADLYQAGTREATEARLVTVELMGFEARVHEQIAEPLKAVNNDLEALLEADPVARRFVSGLRAVAGHNWREIAGTLSRSYHSYGIAVDLAPKSFGGRHTYWRWALPQNEEWYAIPYEQRWMVPLQIVEIFEKHGFVWGGKWFFFDTMHFEYRPEILILAKAASGD
jgi:hypothetical protein